MVPTDANSQNRTPDVVRWVSVALIVVALLVIAHALPIRQLTETGADQIKRLGFWGPAVYGLIYVAATVLFVPGSILTLTAGAVFGLVVGLITVSLGATTGAMLAFLIARYLAREKVAELARKNPRFGAIDRAIAEGGWKIVALLRLSPAVPFNLQNYLYGLTSIGFWPCLLASWLAMLPGAFLYVYLGHVAGTAVAGQHPRSPGQWAMLVVGLLATLAVTIYITALARRKLREQTTVLPETTEAGLGESPEAANEHPGARGGWGGALLSGLLALLAAGLAVYVQLHRETLAQWLARSFG